MPNPPFFQLRRHYISQLEFSSIEEVVPDPHGVEATASIAMGPNTANPRNWRLELTVKFSVRHEQKEISKGTVVFVGIFDVNPQVPEDEMPRLVAINGASILYGAAREMIANISARGSNRLVTLPSISFHDAKLAQVPSAGTSHDPAKRIVTAGM